MEKTNLENKALLDLKNSLNAATKAINTTSKELNQFMRDNMTPKEFNEAKAFMKKYLSLVQKGELVKAKKLQEKYKDGK